MDQKESDAPLAFREELIQAIEIWNEAPVSILDQQAVHTPCASVGNQTEEQYDTVMSVNVKGVWLGCRYAIIQMLKQEPLETGSRGKIVNISSVAGLIGIGLHPAYGPLKAAVINLTRRLAVTYGPQRINVNAVCPGLIPTAHDKAFKPGPRRVASAHFANYSLASFGN
jgi:NAD(P)-dependent dehydrogenase (short-subunit alcohol dehydrogenase family)